MATQFQVLEFNPGIFKNSTDYQHEQGWVDGDKVRFREGKPEKFGGWVRDTPKNFLGVARDIRSWVSLAGDKYIGIATNKKLYVYTGGVYYDVTPVASSPSLTNAISTTSGSNIVTITHASHNRQPGDYVVFKTQATPVGNVNLAGKEYEVKTINVGSYTIQYESNATTTASNQGGALTMDYLMQTGLEFNQSAYGWSAGPWSAETWGTPRSMGTGLSIVMRQWSLDNWGEDLIANPRGGSIYTWKTSLGVVQRATVIPNAPLQSNFIKVIHPYRILASFGATNASGVFDPLLIRWSKSEDYTVWTAAASNNAGGQRLEKGSYIVGAILTKGGALVFTDSVAYEMQYVGYPNVFNFNVIGDKAGLIAQHAATNVNSSGIWMGQDAFYRYDGSIVKLNCSVQEAVFGQDNETAINKDQKEMIFCGVNQIYSEVIWLYPSKGSTKCNRYVVYNYLENVWYDGTLDRSTWEDTTVFTKPYATSSTGVLYQHEVGKNDDASPMFSYITSGYFDIGDGDYMMYTDKFVPDFRQKGNLTLKIRTKKYPESTEEFEKVYTLGPTSGMVNTRTRGRQAKIVIESNTTDGDYHVGRPRLAAKVDGKR